MNITLQKGRLEAFTSETVVAFHFQGDEMLQRDTEAMDKASGGLISEIVQSGDFQGDLYQPSLIYTKGTIPAKRILLMGLGKREDFNLDKWRGAASKAAQFLRDKGIKEFSLHPYLTGKGKISIEDFSQGLVEGIYLGLYQFTEFKIEEKEKIKEVEQVHLVTPDKKKTPHIQKGMDAAENVSKAVYLTRDLVSRPANRKLLAVASGSREPPKFIILEYKPPSTRMDTVVIIGKAITFDSGGLSLKPSENMDKMKHDMGGGAAAIGIIQAVSQLKLPVHLIALIPATENLPSGSAYRPGDILNSLSGKTIEVISTDAEGRLILADALAYSQRFKPNVIIDLATLTGACIIALGENVTGMMGNDDELKEKVWELPLWEEYEEQLKSEIADIKNVGGRPAGTITGGVFLKKFVGEYPWVHLDIAGPVWADKDKPYIPKGATGVGVRLVVQLLRDWKPCS
jgi:leucyl aminopeptidase